MAEKIRTNCILIRKQPYGESSLVLQAFSESLGMFSAIAKGFCRPPQNKAVLLNVMNEYEFILSASCSNGMHTLTEFSAITEFPTDLPVENWALMQAGIELISKILIPAHETPQFYDLLLKYLKYQRGIEKNPVAIFWRFLLHLYKLLGIDIGLPNCSLCHGLMKQPAGFETGTGRPLCADCLPKVGSAFSFSPEAAEVMSVLPMIGNYINDLEIDAESIRQINHFFLYYLNSQFHNNIDLKSLHYYKR